MKIWKKMLSIMLARGRIKIKKHLYLLTIFSVCFIALLLSAVTVSATDTVASGTCGTEGDNLTWTLDSEGVLTISGSGAMEDYYEQNEAQPWEDGRYDIKSVIVNSGVTSIGKHAFFECPNLTSVNINGSVVSIGFGAFEECRNLTSIEIPNGVKSIGACAFF